MSHADFIAAAYLVAGIVLGGLIVATVLDYRWQKHRLAERAPDDGDERP